MKHVTFLLAVLFTAACCRTPDVSRAPAVTNVPSLALRPETTTNALPEDVVAEVGPDRFTRTEMENHVGRLLASVPGLSAMPPQQQQMLRQRATMEAIDQFVGKSLLKREADRRGITASKEDEEKALKDIASRLPPDKSLDEIMKTDPSMRDELVTSLKIKNLLAQVADPSEQEITNFVARVPESVHARHILIKTEPSDTDAAKMAKKLKIDGIRDQLLKGASFADLARKYSDCGSKEKGGDLGLFQRNQMVKPFEDAAFNQATNVIGPVIETKFGYHVIEVLQHMKPGQYPREDAILKLRKEKTHQFVQLLARQVGVKISGSPISGGIPSRQSGRPPSTQVPRKPGASKTPSGSERPATVIRPGVTNAAGAQ